MRSDGAAVAPKRFVNAELVAQQRTLAVMVLNTCDGTLCLTPASGGRMGDSNEPEFFMESFNPLVREWNYRMFLPAVRELVIQCPIFGGKVAGDMGSFLDDLVRIIPCWDGTAASLLELDEFDNNTLDAALSEGGYKQNTNKQDTAVFLPSRGENRKASMGVQGRSIPSLVHLGGIATPSGSNASEVHARINAGNMGWTRLGNFWFSKGPWRVKRLMFQANVAARVLSALESYVLLPSEVKKLDSSLGKKLRAMLCGRAHQFDEDTGTHTSWTALQVWREWQMAPVALELLVRRLAWWQAMVFSPDNHRQFLGVFFGCFRFEITTPLLFGYNAHFAHIFQYYRHDNICITNGFINMN